ncbi:MAG TPA: SpaA isopeptide-forming pilin-related protein [Acidimicrobiales bacterium]|nr:SpaA isopeptide-forming pilin-related protein [Acidimicrobiales bacterium]
MTGGAWTRKMAGAIVLFAGTALAVPATLALTAAPASAHETAPYATQVLVASVPCPDKDVAAATVTFNGRDHHVCANVVVTKTDSWTGKPVAGAGISLFFSHDGQCSTKPADFGAEQMTDASGQVTFTVPVWAHLWDPAVFCVTETTVPPGYTATNSPNTAFVAVSDEIRVEGTDTCTLPSRDGAGIAPNSTDTEEVENVCVSPASLTNDPIPVNIDISKYATGATGLNGATFTLQNSDGSAVTTGSGGVVNGSPTCITAGGSSTAAATCSILNIMIAGTYQLAETAAPTGYNTVPPIPVTVSLGEPPIQVVVTDTATVVPTAAAGGSSSSAVTGATTVHTGEAFAGSAPYVAAMAALGGSLVGVGLIRRRRTARQH